MTFDYDLGILGGGQLARMSIQAAQRMGLRCLSLDPEGKESPAGQVADCIQGSIYSAEEIGKVFRSAKAITLENEFIPAATILAGIERAGRSPDAIIPGLETLAIIQDKWKQRQAYEEAGLGSPPAALLDIDDDGTVSLVERDFGYPVVAKARRGGYDGKGTRTLRSREDLQALIDDLRSRESNDWMLEKFVDFRREVSVMVFRNQETAGCFPTMETVQTNHVCDLVFPSGVDASQIAIEAVKSVQGFGLFGVELFELGDGTFTINEIAPRPHNTGHYTLDWGGVSQFEQHVRLAVGMAPSAASGMPAAMANLLGQQGAQDFRDAIQSALAQIPLAHFHWYGKQVAKPGRKMGHVNATGPDALEIVIRAREAFYAGWQ